VGWHELDSGSGESGIMVENGGESGGTTRVVSTVGSIITWEPWLRMLHKGYDDGSRRMTLEQHRCLNVDVLEDTIR